MISNLVEDGWQIIYHRAHALLAAQLAGHWERSNAPIRLYETIAAISHHDDLEKEWDGNELTPAGAPLDFTLAHIPDKESIASMRGQITSARYRGRFVTLLTSKHLTFLSQTQWGASPEWDEFLNEQIELQTRYQKELGISKDEAERAYQFMRWCDRLSLILVQQKIPDMERALEITSGIDDIRYDVRQLKDGKLTVELWCFEEDEFTVNVEACHVKQLQFKNNQELVQVLQSAPIDILEWTFTKVD